MKARHVAVLMCALVAPIAAQAQSQDEAKRQIAARVELHAIPTLTLTDQQFLAGDSSGTAVTVTGEFRIAQGTGKLPVVVLVHGSRAQAEALYIIDDPVFFAHRAPLFRLASTVHLPTLHELRRWLEHGGLMSYGPDLSDLFRRAALYVDRIFKGAKPTDLPIEQPTKFTLAINAKTARQLGISIPAALQLAADELIE